MGFFSKSFETGFRPAAVPKGNDLLFLFRESSLLIEHARGGVRVPRFSGLPSANDGPAGIRFIGTLGSRDCYAGSIADSPPVPENMTLKYIRELYGILDDGLFDAAITALQFVNWDNVYLKCVRCGGQLIPSDEEPARVCSRCEYKHFPVISPAIITAVVREGKLLLAHAPRFPDDMYSVIAGFVEPGETLEECVLREVSEEVGIRVNNIRYFGSQPWPFPHSLMLGFTADYESGEIVIDNVEITEAGWFGPDNLPRIPGRISIARRLIDWFVQRHGNRS